MLIYNLQQIHNEVACIYLNRVNTSPIIFYLKINYSWVENNSSLIRTHVSCSTKPHLARFLIYIWSEHKNMSHAFLERCHHVVCSHIFNLPLRNIKLDQNLVWNPFFCFSVCWWCQGCVRKKNCLWNPSGRQLSTIFAGGVSISGLRGTFSSISWLPMETKTCRFGTIFRSIYAVHLPLAVFRNSFLLRIH